MIQFRLVGGFDVLTKMEQVEIDESNKPKVILFKISFNLIKIDIIVKTTRVFTDPFEEVDQEFQKEYEERKNPTTKKTETKVYKRSGDESVGVYLK